MPAGPYIGLVDDHHQDWILDMGIPGPDGGKGARYLVLPPGFSGSVPDGHIVAQSPTYKALLAIRAMPTKGDEAGALEALRRVDVYPLANPSAVMVYTDVTNRAIDCTPLRWEDNLEYWRRLHAIINFEPVLDEHRSMYGELAALGIRRGKPFPNASRTHELLESAAKIAAGEMRVESFASRRPDRIAWDDRRWEWIGLVADNASFQTKDCIDLEARDRWFFQAIVTSPAMFRRKAGAGSVYFLAARDADRRVPGRRLGLQADGAAARAGEAVLVDHRLRRGHAVAGTDAAGAGGAAARCRHVRDRRRRNHRDLHRPAQPAGEPRPWIQTTPGRGFFLYLRIYGPEAASLDGTWRPGDLTTVAPAENARANARRGCPGRASEVRVNAAWTPPPAATSRPSFRLAIRRSGPESVAACSSRNARPSAGDP